MKVLISEQQLRRIISEQSSGGMIPSLGYKIINDIEHTYSYTTSDGKISGGDYNGTEKESSIKNYIKSTIGLDNWNKLDDLFKVQLYSYMYQHDSGDGGMRMWWIAGLAQAIDSSISRPSVGKKPLTDPNVVNAIKIIKDACKNGTINSYYKQWLTVVDNQMSGTGSAHPDNYKNVWKNRPRAIERLMKGESWDVVKKEFNSTKVSEPKKDDKKTTPVDKVKSTPVDNTPVSDDNKNYDTLKINTPDLTSFIQEVRTKTQGLTVSLGSLRADITPDNCSFEILYAKPGAKNIHSTLKKIKRFTVALSTQNEGEAAADNILSKNPESKVIRKGTFDNGRTWKLIAVM